jgi:multiple sugar transport system ATP-binding protein
VPDGGIAVDVAVVEPTGADTFVSCRHHDTEMSVVFRERHNFVPGTTIRLKPDLNHSHLFDAGSGQRLTIN